jgi:hypothetical protein
MQWHRTSLLRSSSQARVMRSEHLFLRSSMLSTWLFQAISTEIRGLYWRTHIRPLEHCCSTGTTCWISFVSKQATRRLLMIHSIFDRLSGTLCNCTRQNRDVADWALSSTCRALFSRSPMSWDRDHTRTESRWLSRSRLGCHSRRLTSRRSPVPHLSSGRQDTRYHRQQASLVTNPLLPSPISSRP